ncbi:hypothetical protein C8R45DRAFT_936805 [Mycena sanguinolenta]|nr:hypothetical protein C8R45DRAFT_936805 [Mycena sanguinolenta]
MSDLPNLVMITTATDESVGGAPVSECGAQRAGCDAECAPTDSSVAVATITKLGSLHPPSVHRPSMKNLFRTSKNQVFIGQALALRVPEVFSSEALVTRYVNT